jgi:serine/threonine protein phosphatase PrpC
MSSEDEETAEMPQPGKLNVGDSATGRTAPRVEFGAASHVGRLRSNNEDHYGVVKRTRGRKILLTNIPTTGLNLADDHAYVLVVADGMGGCGYGELASEMILRLGWELSSAAPTWVMKYNLPDIREHIKALGRQMQEEMQACAVADPELAGMGTTWTCGYLMGYDAIIAHVGDSRAYHFRDGTLRQLTRDHTYAQRLQDAGLPAAATAPYSHLLVNSFGAHSSGVTIDVDHHALQDRDRLLLCSDGLFGMVSDERISATLAAIANPQAACDALIELALHNGGKDNVTALVADIHAAQTVAAA